MTVMPDLKQRLLESYHRRKGRLTEQNTAVPLTPTTISPFIHFTEVNTPENFEVRWVVSCLADLLCFVWSLVKKSPHVGEKSNPERSEMVQQWLNELQTSGFLFLFKPKEHEADCLWSKHNILVNKWFQTELTQVHTGNKYNCSKETISVNTTNQYQND